MRNYQLISGYVLLTKFVIFLGHVSAHTSSNATLIPQHSVAASTQTTSITWVRANMPGSHDHRQCTDCSAADYDDPIRLEYQQRKRRKRRRNRKPHSRNEQRNSKNHQYKKHSTRVRLDRPINFKVASDLSDSVQILATDVTSPSITNQASSSVPPPVRYLLPPILDPLHPDAFANETANDPIDTKTTKAETLPANRGSTKFKNTVYYKDYKENEIDTEPVYFSTSAVSRMEVSEQIKPGKAEFKPIVVQPTPPYLPDNTTTQTYLVDSFYDKSKFIISEVANASMQVINTRTPLPSPPPVPENHRISTSDFVSREQQSNNYQKFQHRKPATQNSHNVNFLLHDVKLKQKVQPIFQQLQEGPSPLHSQSQMALNLEVDVPPPMQLTYEWERLAVREETFQNTQYPSTVTYQLNSSRQSDDNIYNEVIPHRKSLVQNYEDAERKSPQSYNQISSKIRRPNSQQGSFTPQQVNNYYSTTAVSPVLTHNSTTTRADQKHSSGKGLDLAETQYFSDLPSEQEVSSLFQNNNQVIPGTAGKDYPIFAQSLLQKRKFACRGLEGYFADISTRCQVFYICNGNGAGEPMLCPNGTLFSQELLVCDWWYNVDC